MEDQRIMLQSLGAITGIVKEVYEAGKEAGAAANEETASVGTAIRITAMIDEASGEFNPRKEYSGEDIISQLDYLATQIYREFIQGKLDRKNLSSKK